MMLSEIRRKAFHFTGLAIPIGYLFVDGIIAVCVLVGLNIFYFSAEILRLFSPTLGRWFLRHFGPILRKDEYRQITGTGYYLIGAFLSILLFIKPFAIVSLCFLIIGDFFAALIGVHWGRTKLVGSKSLEGSLACFVACYTTAFLLLVNPGVLATQSEMSAPFLLLVNLGALNTPHEPLRWSVAAAGALAATLAELFPLGINDNLMIPFVSGLVMTIVVTIPQ